VTLRSVVPATGSAKDAPDVLRARRVVATATGNRFFMAISVLFG
jgi:hypothetical protein